MQNITSAPYADTPIPLYLNSLTSKRYRTLSCMECGREFIERNNDTLYRLNDSSQPSEVAISTGSVHVACGACSQQYDVHVSISVSVPADAVQLHLQPQSIYVAAEAHKQLRYLHCLECGKTFHSLSDRIAQVSDNRVPFEYLTAAKLGPMEAMCRFNNCRQTWALMV